MSDTPADRLRAARLRAGFKKAAEAAAAHEWTLSTYRSHDNGTRGFDKAAAIKYGRAFKVDPSWLLGISKSSRETEAAPQEPPQPWVPKPETIADLLATAMNVDKDDDQRRDELQMYATAVHTGLQWIADDPSIADNPDKMEMVRRRVAEAVAAARSASSKEA